MNANNYITNKTMNNLISKYLDANNLKLKTYDVNCICAFTGNIIKKGVLMKDLIKKTFTDYELIKYKSDYASIEIALLIESVIKGEKGLNSIRNYSFYADKNEFKLLKREAILGLLLNLSEIPFQVGITFSHKKHLAYKTPINYNINNFKICTDEGIVDFDKNKTVKLLSVIQKWYTILPDKTDTKEQQTYFSKANILGKQPKTSQIKLYGIKEYLEENKTLEIYRKTLYFKLITHLLNKSYENKL